MFAEIAPRIYDNGWPAPLPLIGKRPVVPGWDAYNATPVDADTLEDWCERFPRANVGHTAGNGLAFIDQDILDAELAERVDRLADDILRPTPAVRIGRAPKRLRVYRGAGIASRKCHPIEIFGDSGQAVLYGIHPDTRQPYVWIDEDPLSLAPEDLPTITAEQVDAFLAAAAEIITAPARHPGDRGAIATIVDLDLFRRLRTERTALRGKKWLRAVRTQLRTAKEGQLHNTLLSVTAVLVRGGFSDARIRSLIRRHLAAPQVGPYADVWDQVDAAIAGARRRWPRQRDDDDFEARVLRGLGQ